jgi:tetratricopeptide (TPR) repeat protein
LANEYPEFSESIIAYSVLLEKYAQKTMRWEFEKMPNETHMSSFQPAIINGFKFIFDDWYIKNISLLLKDGSINNVKEYYQNLSMKFNYDIELPREIVKSAGFYFLSNKRIEEAIAAFQINTQRYPQSGMAHFDLAQAYKASGQEDLSKSLIFKACRIGRQFEERATGMFCHEASVLGMP